MRIATWNCNRAFRRKAEKALSMDPDILVVQECENPDSINGKKIGFEFSDWKWFGDKDSQGVGLFLRKGFKIQEYKWFDPEIKYIRPFRISCRDLNFVVVPVWTNNPDSPTFNYIGQVWKWLKKYKSKLYNRNCLILGDFNSNSRWDVADRWWNHSDVVRILGDIGIKSLYHEMYDMKQGEERDYTFYMHRKVNKPYHIDYIFGSKIFQNTLTNFQIGDYSEWKEYSDHCPIVSDFDI